MKCSFAFLYALGISLVSRANEIFIEGDKNSTKIVPVINAILVISILFISFQFIF